MKKIIILVVSALLCFVDCKAEEYETHLVVWNVDGSKVTFALKDKPRIEFMDEQMEIKSTQMEIALLISSVSHMNYEDVIVDGISSVQINQKVKMTEEAIIIQGGSADSQVVICDQNGKEIRRVVVGSDDVFTFPVTTLEMGIYVVKINNDCIKFLKK